jgi:PAS domain S-box-containing protein
MLAYADILALRDRAIATAGVSVIVVDTQNPDYPIIDANPAFELLTGYTAAEIIGRNCRFLQGPQTDPASIAALRRAIADVREITVTLLNYRKDGSTFWNEVHVSPAFDATGTLTHYVGVQSDVTDRKRAEDNRNLLVEASGIIAATVHPDDAIVQIARVVVPTISDICIGYLVDPNAPVDEFIPPRLVAYESTREVSAADRQRISDLHPGVSDDLHGVGWVIRTGETTWIPEVSQLDSLMTFSGPDSLAQVRRFVGKSLIIAPIASASRIHGALLFLIDESNRRFQESDVHLARDLGRRIGTLLDNISLYEEAQAAIRARDKFFSLAAHELRTPVVSIKGYAQFLLRSLDRDTLSKERLRHALSVVNASVVRLATLTDDLLSVSRRNLDHLPWRHEVINLGDYLSDFFSESGPAASKGYDVKLDVGRADIDVNVDTERLHQVLTILLGNAAKFSPGRLDISVSAESDADGVTLTISDLGIGLLPGDEEKIFEPFSRTDEAVKGKLSGLGVGLFIARTIVERHQGRIWAESQGLNLGTSVNVWLPAHRMATLDSKVPTTFPAVDPSERPPDGPGEPINSGARETP